MNEAADALYDLVTECAKAHGEADDPDHEVGDLQDVLRMALRLMTKAQLSELATEGTFRDMLELGFSETAIGGRVADEMGVGTDDLDAPAAINAITDHLLDPTSKLEARLEILEEVLRSKGGRGIDAAEEMDALRTVLAARRQDSKEDS